MIGAVLAVAAIAAEPGSQCSLPPGWAAIEAKKPHFIVFGEEHGTRESPELVGRVACALARRGKRLLVAVELSASTDPELQRLWKTPAKDFSQRIVAELPGFAERQDGVGSGAMLALLERLHSLHTVGFRIDVVAFNSFRDPAQEKRWRKLPAQGPHEAAQAENIADAAVGKQYDHVLVLAGSLHAKRRPIHWEKVAFEPMALRLARAGTLLSLKQGHGSGTTWNCVLKSGVKRHADEPITDDMIDCGAHGVAPPESDGSVRVGLGAPAGEKGDPAYDGYYWFPVVHASPPAGGSHLSGER